MTRLSQNRGSTLSGALLMMVLAAVAGSLLTVASHRGMTRIDRVVFASMATASLLLGLCFLNSGSPDASRVHVAMSSTTSSQGGAQQSSRANLMDYAVGNFEEFVSLVRQNG